MILPYFRLEAGHVGLRDAEPEILFQVKVRNQYGEPDQNDSDRDEEFVQIAVFDFLHRFVLGGVFCPRGYFQPAPSARFPSRRA